AHPIGDALEGVSHSLCSLEYEIHRPLYDWVVEKSSAMLPARPRQIEFSRLNITRTVMSKRYLRQLVEGGYVSGWDDPRMPTLCAMRRRGYTPEAVRNFVSLIGMSKADSTVDFALLEHCVRDDLGEKAPRAMAVLDPLKVVLTNWPEGETKEITLENHPDHPEMGSRTLTFGRELYIEREDFMEVPVKKYQRMFPGNEVRLKGAYIVRCDDCVKDAEGNVTEVRCTVDLDSFSGSAGADRKIKGKTLHWVPADDCIPFEARLYDQLLAEDLEEDAEDAPDKKDFIARLNPDSLETRQGFCERFLANCEPGASFQFLRTGYFCKDPDSTPEHPVFNRTVGLRDTFAKQNK
ncbi:MAG: glutamine--tRNA ligase, partial [Clostridia bacterium]|nr:glutamine--tRNA ligase [Clostridia bacterium]